MRSAGAATILREAMAGADPGLPALTAGLEASGRWCLANRALAHLMFWRPVPSFEPSPKAFAPSTEMVDLQRAAIADAVTAGQLGPADVDEAVHLVSMFIVGVLSQAMANEPELEWAADASRQCSPDSWTCCHCSTRPRPLRDRGGNDRGAFSGSVDGCCGPGPPTCRRGTPRRTRRA
jgi:hypothetical protein